MKKGTLHGKKIWLVGASEGIGKALARQLVGEGAVLALTARQEGKLIELAEELHGRAVPADVQDSASVAAAYARIKDAEGTPDMVIYNAGVYEPMTALHFNLPHAEKMMDVNMNGALRVLSALLPDFITAGRGHIVLVASIAAYRGLPGAIGYGASKAALYHLAENLAVDLYGTGITVQVVCPGFVRTRLTDKNSFAMPQIMEADEAAAHIRRGLLSDKFEIRFPFLFSTLLKLLSFLPHGLYFRIVRRDPSQP